MIKLLALVILNSLLITGCSTNQYGILKLDKERREDSIFFELEDVNIVSRDNDVYLQAKFMSVVEAIVEKHNNELLEYMKKKGVDDSNKRVVKVKIVFSDEVLTVGIKDKREATLEIMHTDEGTEHLIAKSIGTKRYSGRSILYSFRDSYNFIESVFGEQRFNDKVN